MKMFRKAFTTIFAWFVGLKCASFAAIDTLKYIFRVENRPYFEYLVRFDSENYHERFNQIYNKFVGERIRTEQIKFVEKEFERAAKRRKRKTVKMR